MNDKEELLDEVASSIEGISENAKLSTQYYLFTLLSIFLFLLIFYPKIYLHQQIYFESRKISRLNTEQNTLKEENRLIKAYLEEKKFKNQILDTLF